MYALRGVLNPWPGEARWKRYQGWVAFAYRFTSEDVPTIRLRVKVEIKLAEVVAS